MQDLAWIQAGAKSHFDDPNCGAAEDFHRTWTFVLQFSKIGLLVVNINGWIAANQTSTSCQPWPWPGARHLPQQLAAAASAHPLLSRNLRRRGARVASRDVPASRNFCAPHETRRAVRLQSPGLGGRATALARGKAT